MAAVPGPLARAAGLLTRAGRAVRWYTADLMGETKYATYVAHLRAHHPDREPVSERQFWREHYAAQDANPGARCC